VFGNYQAGYVTSQDAEIVLNSEPNDDRYRGTPQRFLIDGAHSRTRV
jgi:hypothetical protein